MASTLGGITSFLYLVTASTWTSGIAGEIGASGAQMVILGGGPGSPQLDMSVANPAGDKIILGYADLTEAMQANNPDLFTGGPIPGWFGNPNPDWPGIYSVQFWNPRWESEIFARIDQLAGEGYSGIFLDAVSSGAWLAGNVEGNPVVADATARLAALLSQIRAHISGLHLSHPFYVVVNNPFELAQNDPAALANIDGIFNEQAYFSSTDAGGVIAHVPLNASAIAWQQNTLWPLYQSLGLPVFGNDYPTPHNVAQQTATLLAYARFGFVPSAVNVADTAMTLVNGPYMAIATTATPTVTGMANLPDYLAGGLTTNATLIGGAKADVLVGGTGATVIDAGSGNDTIYPHAPNLASKGFLTLDVINGDTNATVTPMLEVLINGKVALAPTAVTASYSVAPSAPQVMSIDLSGYGAIETVSLVAVGVYYSNSSNFNNIFLTGAQYDGAVVSLSSFTGNASTTLLSGSAVSMLFNSGGRADLAGSVLSSLKQFPSVNGATIDGGKGVDTVNYSLSGTGVTVNLSLTGPQMTSVQTGYDAIVNVENLTGSNHADSLTGDVHANILRGLAGNDHLFGGGGSDTLDGGGGRNVLVGGAGSDTFLFTTLKTTAQHDTITDFVSGVDHIAIREASFAGFSGWTKGALTNAGFGLGSMASTPQQHLYYDSASGGLWYDPDGSGSKPAVEIAVLSNHAHLSAGDIVLV